MTTPPPIVKICGLRTVAHALAAATAGASHIGLVFAPSRRRITPAIAQQLVAELRAHPAGQHVTVVGLFVNTRVADINAVCQQCGLDEVQLSGDELPSDAAGICRPVIRALSLADSPQERAWRMLLPPATHTPHTVPVGGLALRFAACPWIVDASHGTGTPADWNAAHVLAQQYPVLLAGGLTPANVAAAIAAVRPAGVDVSSGVERDGQKDNDLITAFVQQAQQALHDTP